MTKHYQPTTAKAGDLFLSPPEHRPFLDLPMEPDQERVPAYLQTANEGATRWGNLILGVAVDGAIARGVTPARITEALHTGWLVAHADILFDPAPDEEFAGTGFEGSLHLQEGKLMLRGGPHGGPSAAAISFKKEGDRYVPHRAGIDVRGTLQWGDLPQPFSFEPIDPNARAIPPQLGAADRLGDLEALVGPDMFSLRGDILNVH